MKRPRPHIPITVRIQVAERQVLAGISDVGNLWWLTYRSLTGILTLGQRLQYLLEKLPKGAQLDHDPALILRPFDPSTGKYTPDANDPEFLVYREPREHLQKTVGRKADAEKTVTTKGSDIWLKSKFKRLENPSTKPRAKIQSPPFGKPKPKKGPGPKLQSISRLRRSP